MKNEVNHINILIIEDNLGDFYLIEEYLQETGLSSSIEHVSSFNLARKKLQEESNNYQAILLDLSLPDKSGEELIHEVMVLAPSIPIIILTGYSDKQFSVRSLSLGVSDYLLKDELSASQLNKSIYYSIERKRFTHQLRSSEEKYRQLFDLNPLPMWVYDLQSLRFLSVNNAAIRDYGYSREEFQSMTLHEIRPREDIEILEKSIFENMYPNDYNKGIYRHKKKNGDVIDVEVQSNEIYFEGKQARLVLATNISERMRHIRAIEEQNEVMREIAWIQSHVVRAPLARIIGLVNIMECINKDEEINILRNIKISAIELDGIIRNIVRKTEQVEKEINNEE